RRGLLTRSVALRDRTFFDRKDGSAVGAIEHEREGLLRQLHHRLDRLAVYGDVRENRRGRHVVVPDIVMRELVMPDAFTGLDIEADDGRRKQIIARTLSAVLIARRAFDGNVDITKLFI